MKRMMMLGCLVLVLTTVVGCAGFAPGTPLLGMLYSDVRYPHVRTEVVNEGIGSKKGEAMAKDILGWIAVGDASIEAAMRDGKITKIYTIDHHMMNILGLYAEWKTIVTGE